MKLNWDNFLSTNIKILIRPGVTEHEKVCACGSEMTMFGEEISEKLGINSMKVFVDRTIHYKFAWRCCKKSISSY